MGDGGDILPYLTNRTLDELLHLLNFGTAREFIEQYDLLDEFQPIAKPLSINAIICLATCYSLIFAFALVGNALIVIIITRKRSMQTVINVFILSLAISDLLIVFFCIPFTLIDTITVDWVLGSFMCKALNYITMVAIAASILTLTVIVFERHHPICYPFRARMIQTPKRTVLLVSIVWGMSIVFASPLITVLTVFEHYGEYSLESSKFCREMWANKRQKRRFTLLLFVFLYIILLFIMVILYLQVTHRLWIRKAVAPFNVTVVVLFAICWLPYHTVSLARDFSQLEDVGPNRLLLAVVQLIALSNSFNNPILYMFLNDSFKRNVIHTLTIIIFRRRRTPSRIKRSSARLVPSYDVATTL